MQSRMPFPFHSTEENPTLAVQISLETNISARQVSCFSQNSYILLASSLQKKSTSDVELLPSNLSPSPFIKPISLSIDFLFIVVYSSSEDYFLRQFSKYFHFEITLLVILYCRDTQRRSTADITDHTQMTLKYDNVCTS